MTRALGRAVVAAAVLAVATPAVRAIDLPVPGTSTHVDASGYVDGLAVAEIGGPRQRPQAITELRFQSKLTRMLRAQLTLRGRAGGPFEGGHPGIMNFVHEFQNRTPSLEFNEAFAELRLGDAQIRAGIQKFAWGKLDGVPPTDVLTPRDLHDPLVRDFEESKIGIPAVQATYFLPPAPFLDLSELRASLVYVPIAVPARLALRQERWFPPTIAQHHTVIGKQLLTDLGVPVDRDQGVAIRVDTLNSRPPTKFDAGGGAARLAGSWRDIDWSVSHYTGPETGPNADLVVHARCVAGQCFVLPPGGSPRLTIGVHSFLRQEHDIIHMTGADWSAVFGGATVRGEVAAFQNRPSLRVVTDMIESFLQRKGAAQKLLTKLEAQGHAPVRLGELFPDRDTVEWGLGADYLIGGFLPLIQVNQVIFTDSGPEQLLSNPETRLLGSIRRRFWQDTLEVEVRGVYAIERGASFVFPRVTYRLGDSWRFRMGYLTIAGPSTSYIGQFHDNDEVVLEARYGF